MLTPYDPFAAPEIIDGLYGGMIPTPPDQYARVWAWPRYRVTAAIQRGNHDLRDYQGESLFPPIGDQGPIGSCAAFAFGYYLRAALAAKWHVDNGSRPDLPDTLAPRWLYDLTRQRMGTYPRDSGSDMLSAASVLREFGIPPERDCPYTGQADNGPITEQLTPHMREAANFYGISGYWRLEGQGEALLDSIEQCLAAAQPVVLAVLIPESFTRTGANGRVPDPRPGEAIFGGHALAVWSNFYDRSFGGGRCLGGPNSWTTGWGENGGYYLPASYATTRHEQYGYFLQEAWTVC
jgi:hypothetical protein